MFLYLFIGALAYPKASFSINKEVNYGEENGLCTQRAKDKFVTLTFDVDIQSLE